MKVLILGNADRSRPARASIIPAISDSARSLNISVECAWQRSCEVDVSALKQVAAVFIAPGGPDEESDGILQVIRACRERDIPCLGTCGGFQRMISEFALNVLHYKRIEHQEIHPDANDPLFAEMSCSLVGSESRVWIKSASIGASAYGRDISDEMFMCRFGLGHSHMDRLKRAGLSISGVGAEGEPRIIELTEHTFFVGTLFVPQMQSWPENPHPLISAWLRVGRDG